MEDYVCRILTLGAAEAGTRRSPTYRGPCRDAGLRSARRRRPQPGPRLRQPPTTRRRAGLQIGMRESGRMSLPRSTRLGDNFAVTRLPEPDSPGLVAKHNGV